MGELVYLKPKNDRERFFESDEAYTLYSEAEIELMREPLDLDFEFDWIKFFKSLSPWGKNG